MKRKMKITGLCVLAVTAVIAVLWALILDELDHLSLA